MATTTWTPLDRGVEGIEVLEDGRIRLPMMRVMGKVWETVMDTPDHPTHIKEFKLRKIRLTLAIPLDHTTRAAVKLTTDPSNLPTGSQGANEDDIAQGYIRQHYTSAESCKKWLRKDSYPVPQSLKDPYTTADTEKFPDKLGGDGTGGGCLRNDQSYLNAEAIRILNDVGRVAGEKPIILKGVCLDWNPGDVVGNVGDIKVNKSVKEVIWHCGETTQCTELVLA